MNVGDKVCVTCVKGEKIGKIADIRGNIYYIEFDDSEDREGFLECEIYPIME